MKQQLHKNNTPCHPERSEGSHSLIRKLPHWLIFSFLFISLSGYAQNYQWDWGLTGGGSTGEIGWNYQAEQIFDIAIDSNNNYYFLAKIKNGSPQLNGQPVTVYGNPQGGNDIFLFSTTSSGTVRWSQTIGGGGLFDAAYKIALDSNNNVYVGTTLSVANANKPVHFSPTEALPGTAASPSTFSDYFKTTFLVKYDTNGQFVWKRALQGDVNNYNSDSTILDILIDSNDNIHFIAGLYHGTHLNNTVTVPTTSTGYQYYLVRYTTAGQLINSMLLPVADGTGFVPPSFTFKLDEANNRYYIAGFRSYNNAGEDIPLTYSGSAFTKNSYILAINATNGNEIWRREIDTESVTSDDNRLYDLVVDTNGDIYICGKLSRGSNKYIKIINPKNPTNNPYNFTFDVAYGLMPFIVKLNKNGVVQWARTPSGYNWGPAITGSYYAFGVVINGNEVALATDGSNTIWDTFNITRPQNHQSDPLLVRFNKQTGAVVGMHDIMASGGNIQKMTAVAVDNNGNYVVGGCFMGNIFTNNFNGIPETATNGTYYDFFVTKLTNPLSTDKFNKLNVNVYPNPTNNIVNIETAETLQNYEVYNVLGQQIQNGSFNGNTQINLHGATAGTYFIKVTTVQGSTATVKVVKK
ncbi:Por secretion system C-terminal sorting domain-containing protein [Paenimyroides aquimaris]|uniref:Por secretion system C-terminal sorting domain-containing protein n=1 Tax=Paenimyroides marinum TaxID=1159016 RepID=A0A1H6J2Q9_9FLAO|nr:T9SS type A sorting domain-containing protein [Paenimyroides aquimaris]SEH53719.1 Por secretion system C-terminal sorting domain-containing protein [Paenimyroides aquimaris]